MGNFIVYGYQDKEKPTMWYIGKTIKDITERDRCHKHKSRSVFDKHYKKYPKRYSLCILKKCQSESEMNNWERTMIARFNSMWPNGYNFTAGGDGMSGFKMSDESKEKNRISNLGIHAGKNHPMYQKHPSDETREKMRLAKLKWTSGFKEDIRKRISNTRKINKVSVGENNPRARLVESQVIEIRNCFKDGITMAELSRKFGVGKTTIGHIVHNESWRHLGEARID